MAIMMRTTTTIDDIFDEFISDKKGMGISPKTIKSYQGHWNRIKQFMDGDFTNPTTIFKRMVEADLKDTTINAYSRTLKTFYSWAREHGYTSYVVKLYKCQEVSKDPYTDEELARLLEKPNMKKCDFTEYRCWVQVNFLLDTGCRASTLRSVSVDDIDFERKCVTFRTLKNKKVQVNPLSDALLRILREYIKIRGNVGYLFCNSEGDQQTENSLRLSMVRYNRRRGVQKTSIHLFRHTFAKKYLLECDGDPFRLQRLLGHATLMMTRKYCNLYDQDVLGISTPLDVMKKHKKIKIS